MGKEEIFSNNLFLNGFLTKDLMFFEFGLYTYIRSSAFVGTKFLDKF